MLDWEWIDDNNVVFYYNGKKVAKCYDTDFNAVYRRLCSEYRIK